MLRIINAPTTLRRRRTISLLFHCCHAIARDGCQQACHATKATARPVRYVSSSVKSLSDCFAEINDEGLYGHGQLASLLRARYCDPRIKSVTKTDGLPWKVKEILNRSLAITK